MICLQLIPYLLLVALTSSSGSEVPGKENLSEYEFFDDLQKLEPAEGVIPYELNTPLFTDYAWKKRFIYIPDGKVMEYREDDVFDLPEGSVLIKNFYYPHDFRVPEAGVDLVETRLLIREGSGWKALPYIWNEQQTDAVLTIQGGVRQVSWRHYNGRRMKIDYLVPNINQCKGCHSVNGTLKPIGIAARHLNREGIDGFEGMNQLEALFEMNKLDRLPAIIPANSDWKDPDAGIDDRARSWLDINCAHCHSDAGPASNTGLYLGRDVSDPTQLGILKPPVAAGAASRELQYDIVPGKPNESILLHRMVTDDVAQRMPEIGRTIMDREAVELIKEWIRQLDQ